MRALDVGVVRFDEQTERIGHFGLGWCACGDAHVMLEWHTHTAHTRTVLAQRQSSRQSSAAATASHAIDAK
jgi:hypothetical protein